MRKKQLIFLWSWRKWEQTGNGKTVSNEKETFMPLQPIFRQNLRRSNYVLRRQFLNVVARDRAIYLQKLGPQFCSSFNDYHVVSLLHRNRRSWSSILFTHCIKLYGNSEVHLVMNFQGPGARGTVVCLLFFITKITAVNCCRVKGDGGGSMDIYIQAAAFPWGLRPLTTLGRPLIKPFLRRAVFLLWYVLDGRAIERPLIGILGRLNSSGFLTL